MGKNTNYDNEAASDESKTCRYIYHAMWKKKTKYFYNKKKKKSEITRHGKIDFTYLHMTTYTWRE